MNSSRHSHCYLLSHCQIEHPVYLGTSSVTKRCLHSYQHLFCDYSAWVVTLSVLELVQLADMFRFVVKAIPGYALRFLGWGSQISRQSAQGSGKVVSLMHQDIFLVPISVEGWVDPMAILRPDGCQWKIPTATGIEPATFRLGTQCLDLLRHCVPQIYCSIYYYRYELAWTGSRDINTLVLWGLRNLLIINRNKMLNICDRLPLVSQGLPAVMYIQLVTEWSRPYCRNSHWLIHSSSSTRCKEK
jgi:hypothetical protein